MAQSPSSLAIEAVFTKNGGQPATGLTLSDITFRLVKLGVAGSEESVIWESQVATNEASGTGRYYVLFDEALLDQFNYFSLALYAGPEVLDSDYYSKRYKNV